MGRRLLDRTPRLVRLSPDGTSFLPAARALVAAQHKARIETEHWLLLGMAKDQFIGLEYSGAALQSWPARMDARHLVLGPDMFHSLKAFDLESPIKPSIGVQNLRTITHLVPLAPAR